MRRLLRTIVALSAILCMAFSLCACQDGVSRSYDQAHSSVSQPSISEDGEYTDKESVALYVHRYGHVPSNYVSKTKARNAGWISEQGNLWDVLPGKSIGGSRFDDDEDQLPDAPGRTWTECDIGYSGGRRGPERMIFSNDGLIYYTPDHYRHFERLY